MLWSEKLLNWALEENKAQTNQDVQPNTQHEATIAGVEKLALSALIINISQQLEKEFVNCANHPLYIADH